MQINNDLSMKLIYNHYFNNTNVLGVFDLFSPKMLTDIKINH